MFRVQTPESSFIAHIGYNSEQTLEIATKSGKVYWYFGVPDAEWRDLLNEHHDTHQGSVGSLYNYEIKGQYPMLDVTSMPTVPDTAAGWDAVPYLADAHNTTHLPGTPDVAAIVAFLTDVRFRLLAIRPNTTPVVKSIDMVVELLNVLV